MYRNAIEQLKQWKDSKNRKPLIIEGARQVGKTWLMQEFGKVAFANTVYINFDSNPRMERLFSSNLDPQKLITGIELYAEQKITNEYYQQVAEEYTNLYQSKAKNDPAYMKKVQKAYEQYKVYEMFPELKPEAGEEIEEAINNE